MSNLEVNMNNLEDVEKLLKSKTLRVCVVGIGRIGLPTALSGSLFPSWELIYGANFLETNDSLLASAEIWSSEKSVSILLISNKMFISLKSFLGK